MEKFSDFHSAWCLQSLWCSHFKMYLLTHFTSWFQPPPLLLVFPLHTPPPILPFPPPPPQRGTRWAPTCPDTLTPWRTRSILFHWKRMILPIFMVFSPTSFWFKFTFLFWHLICFIHVLAIHIYLSCTSIIKSLPILIVIQLGQGRINIGWWKSINSRGWPQDPWTRS